MMHPRRPACIARRPAQPHALGQGVEQTGIPVLDQFTASQVGRAVIIGGIAGSLAKSFPGQYFAPFLAASVLAVLTGVATPAPPSTPVL